VWGKEEIPECKIPRHSIDIMHTDLLNILCLNINVGLKEIFFGLVVSS
jgi:hypothetical protein